MLPLSSGPYGTIYLLHVRVLKQSDVQWIFAKNFLPDGTFRDMLKNISSQFNFLRTFSFKNLKNIIFANSFPKFALKKRFWICQIRILR